MYTNSINVLENLTIVNLEINVWTARKKLQVPDLGTHADLPPQELATLGSKRVCNPEELKTFGTLKARAVSLLDRHGIRFLGGWAIPENGMPEICRELGVIRDEFIAAKTAFLLHYEEAVQSWIDKHPDWSEMIANSTVAADYVRARLDFRWQVFKVAPSKYKLDAEHQGTLIQDATSLGGTLFEEVAQAANAAWRRCYAGKTEITRKALSPLKSIYEKLRGLSFVEPRVTPVMQLLDTAFCSIPKRGAIRGTTLIMLQGLVALLQNPKAVLEHGQLILDGHKNPKSVLEGLLLQECAKGVELESLADFEGEEDEELEANPPDPITPLEVLALPPVIESHGLW